MTFNPETLYLASGISRCAFLMVFLATVLSQPGERCLRYWLAALVASATGALSMVLIPNYPMAPFPLSLIITTLFVSSLSLSWSGLRIFYQRSVNVHLLLWITVTPTLVLLGLTVLDAPLTMQMAPIFLVTSVLTFLCALEILRPPRTRILSQYVVALAFVSYFVVLFVPFVMLMTGQLSIEIMASGQAAIMADQILCILIYFGFIAMTSERANHGMKRLSETDQLTGLANRRAMQEALKIHKERRRTGRTSSVIVIDIDHFKRVNDRLGHEAGDSVLKHFAQHLLAVTRQQDTPVRWGGEEFLIVLPDTSIEDAMTLAERLRHRVETMPLTLAQQTLRVTISLGVAETYPDSRDIESIVRHADEALYRAKREGRNRVCRYPPP